MRESEPLAELRRVDEAVAFLSLHFFDTLRTFRGVALRRISRFPAGAMFGFPPGILCWASTWLVGTPTPPFFGVFKVI
jgi:hypothetical protein